MANYRLNGSHVSRLIVTSTTLSPSKNNDCSSWGSTHKQGALRSTFHSVCQHLSISDAPQRRMPGHVDGTVPLPAREQEWVLTATGGTRTDRKWRNGNTRSKRASVKNLKNSSPSLANTAGKWPTSRSCCTALLKRPAKS